jgi:hypothetical protein
MVARSGLIRDHVIVYVLFLIPEFAGFLSILIVVGVLMHAVRYNAHPEMSGSFLVSWYVLLMAVNRLAEPCIIEA